MGRTLLDLAKSLEKRREKIEKGVNQITIKFVTELLLELVDKTPVDTSEALSNWQVGIDEKPGERLAPYYPGIDGSTAAESARAAYDTGKAILATRRVGGTVYISNLAEHIVYLNQGSSSQAPAGFVEQAILAAKLRMKNFNVKLVD